MLKHAINIKYNEMNFTFFLGTKSWNPVCIIHLQHTPIQPGHVSCAQPTHVAAGYGTEQHRARTSPTNFILKKSSVILTGHFLILSTPMTESSVCWNTTLLRADLRASVKVLTEQYLPMCVHRSHPWDAAYKEFSGQVCLGRQLNTISFWKFALHDNI